jgi:hypothetical protein
MATVLDILKAAGRKIGVIASGQGFSTEEEADAFLTFNRLIDSWSAAGVPIYQITKTAVTLNGAASYTLPDRPTKIQSASTLTAAGLNKAPEIVTAAGWAGIPDKTRTGLLIEAIFCDYGFPDALVYVTPKPSAGSLELYSFFPIEQFADVDDTVTFPPGYERSLIAALAVDLADEFGREVSQSLMLVARDAMGAIAKLNSDALGIIPPAPPVEAAAA